MYQRKENLNTAIGREIVTMISRDDFSDSTEVLMLSELENKVYLIEDASKSMKYLGNTPESGGANNTRVHRHYGHML